MYLLGPAPYINIVSAIAHEIRQATIYKTYYLLATVTYAQRSLRTVVSALLLSLTYSGSS